MNDLGHVLLGAGLVVFGVMAAALADRIRGLRTTHERAALLAYRRYVPRAMALERGPTALAHATMQHDVVSALVGAGYSKRVATEATEACTPNQRSTIESWTRAALRRCAQGAA